MKLTVPQITGHAQAAGFRGSALTMAVAIAMAESGGDPAAIGDVDRPHKGCRSYGLWQINVCPQGTSGGNNRGIPWRENPQSLLDPAVNARAAFEMSGGGNNYKPWTTWTSGAANRLLGTVSDALAAAGGPVEPGGTVGTAGGVSGGLSGPSVDLGGLVSLGTMLTDPKTWLRVVMFIGGGVLTVAGVLTLARDSTVVDAVQGAAGAAVKAAPKPGATP